MSNERAKRFRLEEGEIIEPKIRAGGKITSFSPSFYTFPLPLVTSLLLPLVYSAPPKVHPNVGLNLSCCNVIDKGGLRGFSAVSDQAEHLVFR